MSMNRNRNKIKHPLLFLSIFILIGLYFISIGIFPVEIKIEHFNNESVAKIHKKSGIPPFKDINITVSNLKQAIIGTSRSSKGGTTYRVELESYNGIKTPVMAYYSSGYRAKQNLQDKINESIRKKIEFKYTIKQYGFVIFGSLFCFIPLIIIITLITQKNEQNNTLKQTNQQTQFSQQEVPQSEDEKYKKINDLIIK